MRVLYFHNPNSGLSLPGSFYFHYLEGEMTGITLMIDEFEGGSIWGGQYMGNPEGPFGKQLFDRARTVALNPTGPVQVDDPNPENLSVMVTDYRPANPSLVLQLGRRVRAHCAANKKPLCLVTTDLPLLEELSRAFPQALEDLISHALKPDRFLRTN